MLAKLPAGSGWEVVHPRGDEQHPQHKHEGLGTEANGQIDGPKFNAIPNSTLQ